MIGFARVAIILLLCAPAAYANAHKCGVIEISAEKAEKPIVDKALPSKIKKALDSPMLAAWNVFKLVGNHEVTLTVNKPKTLQLSKAHKLTTTLTQVKTTTKKLRYTLEANLDDAKKKRLWGLTIDVDEGRYFYVTKKSGRILAFRCNK